MPTAPKGFEKYCSVPWWPKMWVKIPTESKDLCFGKAASFGRTCILVDGFSRKHAHACFV